MFIRVDSKLRKRFYYKSSYTWKIQSINSIILFVHTSTDNHKLKYDNPLISETFNLGRTIGIKDKYQMKYLKNR